MQVRLQDLARRGVVVHHQGMQALQIARHGREGGRSVAGQLEPGFESERAAATGLAVHPDAPSHHLHQLPADGQAQARAPEAPGGGVIGLREGLEQPGHLLGRHADTGVAHRKAQGHIFALQAHQFGGHHDVALLGELAGVAREIGQHLRQAQGVTHQAGRNIGLA